MNLSKLIKYHKKNLIIIFFIIVLLQLFKIPYNINLINKRSYEVRMFYSHGRCDKDSYGFITSTLKEFNIVNEFPFIYFENSPGIYGLLMPHKKEYNSKYVFIVNYAETEDDDGKLHNKILDINETSFNFIDRANIDPNSDQYIDLKKYSLKKRNGNCYFWVKND